MPDQPRLVHLNADGPDGSGLSPLDLDEADFQSTLPVQHAHIFFEDQSTGLAVGVWDTTTMQEAFGPYPGDEFIWVLEGHFSMIDGDGNAVSAGPGDSVVLRNGAPMSWKQDGYLKKFFITLPATGGTPTKAVSNDGAVIVMDPDAPLHDVSEPGGPAAREHVAFTNDAGNMRVGLWECGAADFGMCHVSVHEFVQVLAGEATITEANGTKHQVKAGDCFFIPKGTECRWQVSEFVKKYYVQTDTD